MNTSGKFFNRITLVCGFLVYVLVGNAQSDIIKSDTGYIEAPEQSDFHIPFYQSNLFYATAPIDIIKGTDLEKYSTSDLTEALTGLVPNGIFMSLSSRPGNDNASMRIRGFNYLVLVDGVPRPISELSAYEIESVNILKGLSTTAMYGSDARDGIVYIQTKRGKAGDSYIDVDVEYGQSAVVGKYLPVWLNSWNYARLYNEAFENDGLPAYYNDEALAFYLDGTAPIRYPDEELYNMIFNNSMEYRKLNISHGGGSETARFFLNLRYQGEGDGLYKISSISSNTLGIRSNLDVKISDFLKLNADVYGNLHTLKSPNAEVNTWAVLGSYPSNAYPVLIAPDTFGTSETYRINPVGDLTNHLSTKQHDMAGRFNLGLELDLSRWIEGLSTSANLAYDINTLATFVERPDLSYTLYEPVFSTSNTIPDSLKKYGINNPSAGISQVNRNYYRQFLNYMKIDYKRNIGNHQFMAGILNKFYSQKYFWVDAQSQDIMKQDLGFNLAYNFRNRYFIDYIMSYTGLRNLPADRRFKMFPTIGLSWVLSEESFIEDNDFITFLKLRTSYGSMGFYNSQDTYLYNTYWTEGTWTVFNNRTESSRQNFRGTYLVQMGNESIDWAVQTEFNIGLDAVLMEDRIALGLNFYDILREGIIMRSPVPLVNGSRNFFENIGSERYNGVDLSLQYKTAKNKSFKYSLGFNAGYNFSEVIASNNVEYPYEWMKREGKPVDAFFGLVSEGLLSSEDLLSGPVQTFGAINAGNISYKDLNSDGLVQSAIDEEMIGYTTPRYNYGIQVKLHYKNLGLYILGYGLADYDVNIRNNSYFYAYGNNKYSDFVMQNRWTNENPDPSAKHPRLTSGSNSNDNRNSSYWLIDGSFFTIKNMELSYTFPTTGTEQNGIHNLALFIRANNLLTFSKVKDLYPGNINFGVSTYPSMRTISTGFSVSF
ncbi:MAG: SusC/RagA family TonB-linked outer membrane protein [Bacteroidales bacterium]